MLFIVNEKHISPLDSTGKLRLTGKVIDSKTKSPIAFANIGLFERNIGTLSDPDGSFELIVPRSLINDFIIFSAIGYERQEKPVGQILSEGIIIELKPSGQLLNEVVVTGKRTYQKVARLGWMGGNDGVLPFDTIQGGGTIALLVESPSVPFDIEKLQVRLLYNSKETLMLRLHLFTYDTARQIPGEDLLTKEIILKEEKRFGWLRFDLSEYQITLMRKKFFIGFEWIDDRETRNSLLKGLKEWEKWKRDQYNSGNEKVERLVVKTPEGEHEEYKYRANMMNWPGFKSLPPFTGLMVQSGKNGKTVRLKTFERKTSMGKWSELNSTLNVIVTIKY
ncbi:hypothetical protein WSM22_24510 [Cytophagales bacterium WSM2-2]|nr:hypothetical protein WSM22_24510 [Cytophagales bacterium WSM2-2]